MTVKTFDWTQEVNQLMTKTLITTFGLDFLLLEDKKGGDVDTIHNVRNGIWATEAEQKKYETRKEYDSSEYHQHKNYINKGRSDKASQQSGELQDAYLKDKTMQYNQDRDLDHVISAFEIDQDPGRILASCSGTELANQHSNLKSTASGVNRTKQSLDVEAFLKKVPLTIKNREAQLEKLNNKLNSMPTDTPQQKHLYRETQDQIRKKQNSLNDLKNIDPEKMRQADREAREKYNQQINTTYYNSSKFFNRSIEASMNTGFRMGTREALGLVFAEVWFELRAQIPEILKKYKAIDFNLVGFFNDLKNTTLDIFERVKLRFKDIFNGFKDGAIAGAFASISTTIVNIFLTTTKFWGKMIREIWLNIVNMTKLVFFNPESLTTGELTKAALKILSASIGVVVGMLLNEHLLFLESIPVLGSYIRVFLTAFTSGVVILGLNYFLEQSPVMIKFWNYLDSFKSRYEHLVDHYQEVNSALDQYILELTQLEFGIDVDELEDFSQALLAANSEMERQFILKRKVDQMDIKLPFEMGNKESTKNWILGKMKV